MIINLIKKTSEEDFDVIAKLYDFIQTGLIKVKIFVDRKLHTKLYIFNRRLPAEFGGTTDNYAIFGSSNLSYSGFKNNLELNAVFRNQDEFDVLTTVFDKLWNVGLDYSDELLKSIEDTPQFKKQYPKKQWTSLSPKNFVIQEIIQTGREYLLEEQATLLPFQVLDYQRARQKLEDYKGVILASSVGLGKSYVASQIILDYLNQDKKILLIIPPSLLQQWKDYLQDFKINPEDQHIKIVSLFLFGKKNFESDISEIYDLIVIDEVHNFRSSDSNRYKNLIKIPKTKTNFVLLTATPMNNSFLDIFNIISIFHDEEIFKQQLLEQSYFELSVFVKEIEGPMRKLETEGDLRAFLIQNANKIESQKQSFLKLRDALFVQTTRIDLKKMREEYYQLRNSKTKFFVKDPELHLLEYKIGDKKNRDLYTQIQDYILNLNLPQFSPFKENSLSGLFYIFLAKRLESSPFAFYYSLINLIRAELVLLLFVLGSFKLKNYYLENKEKFDKLSSTEKEDDSSIKIEDLIHYYFQGKNCHQIFSQSPHFQ